jgi:hypothetical protein
MLFLWKILGFRRLAILFVLRRLWRMYQQRASASRPNVTQ